LEEPVDQVDVALLMGSASDWKHLQPAVETLDQLGLAVSVHVTSAHRTPERTVAIIREAEQAGCQVFICAAGMAAHLAGVVAAHTLRPVLGVPLPGGVLDGVDALLSTVQMPGGIPVATFAVGSAGARNAACFAAQIVALNRPAAGTALQEQRRAGADKVMAGEDKVRGEIAERRKAQKV
jgi:5-(carboxyamino)imidazole ribonucleotide mutase